jgi:spore maturation protein CgeB
MSGHLVRTADEAFLQKDYSQALQLYREAGERLGHNLFAARRHLCQKLFYRVQAALADQELRSSEFADSAKQIKYADRFRVAFIADEFTTNSFSDEFIAIPLEPADWREKIEQHQPELFFCESAWSGPDSKRRPWKGQIYASKNFPRENRTALLEILAHCRQQGIPTLFWNKEDPTHFADRVHDFVKTAKEFDCVFTSAAECVEGYQREYGVSRAFALPFATNPRLFNPIESGHRSSRVVFAGSWYANHVQRSKDMEHILDAIRADGYELEIYDRYHGDPDPLHLWPDRYQRFLKASQPHDRMPDVYKSSRYGLNFNTVTDSPTMFARRVFELMSSNTLVISNYSRGTDEMFGDLLVYPDRHPTRLRALTDADIDELRERALNKVLREHTYKQRWLQILQSIGVAHAARDFTITATCLVDQQDDARAAIAWFQQHGQQHPGGQLLLVANAHMADLEVADLYRQFNRAGVSVTSCSHATRYAILDRYQPVETSHFLAFHPRHAPPADWLSRAALHLQYATEYPLSPASDAQQRYRTGLASPDAPFLDLRGRFGLWLHNPNQRRAAYFV